MIYRRNKLINDRLIKFFKSNFKARLKRASLYKKRSNYFHGSQEGSTYFFDIEGLDNYADLINVFGLKFIPSF